MAALGLALFLFTSAAWHFRDALPFADRFLFARKVIEGVTETTTPDPVTSLAPQLQSQLPTYFKVVSLSVNLQGLPPGTVGPKNLPFRATVELAEDTYGQGPFRSGVLYLVPRARRGERHELTGTVTLLESRRGWAGTFFAERRTIEFLGLPRTRFVGPQVMIQGSPEALAFESNRSGRVNQQPASRDLESQELASATEQASAKAIVDSERAVAEQELESLAAGIPTVGRVDAPSAPVAAATPDPEREAEPPLDIPLGSEIDVRLLTPLNSGIARIEDRVEAVTIAPLVHHGRTIIPQGSHIRGVVAAVERATRSRRTARMRLTFDLLTMNGQSYLIDAFVALLEGRGLRGDATRVGAGAGAGALIGALLGGAKGAAAGAAAGGGGTLALTEGREIDLRTGTVLRVRFERTDESR